MSEQYRFAFLSHLASTPAPTGAERSLALLAAGLARRGHAVTVIVPRDGWVLAGAVRDAGGTDTVVPTRNAWLIWQGRRNPLYTAGKWALAAAAARSGQDRLTRVLRRIAPDVVHVNCLPGSTNTV